MPIFYRSLTTAYQDIPIRDMRFAVEDAEYQFSLFLAGKIDDVEFATETGYFSCVCEHASVAEVFSQEPSLRSYAQTLVNRSEMMQRARDLVCDHWRDERGNKVVANEDNYKHFCSLILTLEPDENPGDHGWDGLLRFQDLPDPAI